MKTIPLAERVRPKTLEEVVGQDHLVGPEGWLTRMIAGKKPLSILFWGPPGCGKTTLARLYAKAFEGHLVTFSAGFHGTADLKKVIKEAKEKPLFAGQLIVFIDEIHRFNKAQQDALLPFIEDGTMILIGATTENPSFSLNNALLSRLRLITLKPLDPSDLRSLLTQAEQQEISLPLTEEAKEALIALSAGDARHLLNMVENLQNVPSGKRLTPGELADWVQRRPALYDKGDEGHYNLISALHKSVRGSDPDSSLYWLARMLQGGEDPQFIARRLVRMASEDIGLADPEALNVTLSAWKAFDQLGAPEGELALAQATLYLALAPKSNALYTAYKAASALAGTTGERNPPKIILNAPTQMMKAEGYGKGYLYDHDAKDGFSGQNYFPDGIARQSFYTPIERGFEREMKKRLDYFNSLRAKKMPSPRPQTDTSTK
ncbi:MAG: Replication-associated recombination protein A [Chlamydiae bacterium]|nr:Replication-associated recombination protein A [Chlamydiota bacterium]